MTRYVATITHHTIGRAPTVPAGDTLAAAKRAATREFGQGYLDHTIQILDTAATADPAFWEPIACRRVSERRWSMC